MSMKMRKAEKNKVISKKAATQMWWIIIGAVIALVVMIVLLVMFTGKSSKAGEGFLDCKSKGGECLTEDKCKNPDGTKGTISTAFTCTPDTDKCCFKEKKTAP